LTRQGAGVFVNAFGRCLRRPRHGIDRPGR
jgi:hypothetical protein